MSLWFDLHVNEDAIGSLVIMRKEETAPGMFNYEVTWGDRNGSLQFMVSHAYIDGALILVASAITGILERGEYGIPVR